jgi:hypothetical protein
MIKESPHGSSKRRPGILREDLAWVRPALERLSPCKKAAEA